MLIASGYVAASEEDDGREVVKQYAAAIADGDEGTACVTLTKESRKQFKRSTTTCVNACADKDARLGLG
jgi:hypothetical protein